MNYGLYLSASGVLTNMYRQDVFANNLANAHTVGFKPDIPGLSQRPPESIEDDLGFQFRQDLLDRLGGGVFAGPQHVNFKGSQMQKTSGPLDVAIEQVPGQPPQFFAVSATDRQTQQRQVFLTRDGRFATDAGGALVTVAGGHQVLDQQDRPIQLGPGPVIIDGRGVVHQNGEPISVIQVAFVDDPQKLIKQGGNLFKIDPSQEKKVVESAKLLPGFVEASGTDPIMALMNLIKATKAVTGNGNLIRYHDSLMDRAVNVLGRVVA